MKENNEFIDGNPHQENLNTLIEAIKNIPKHIECSDAVNTDTTEYDEWEDFWINLHITEEELDNIDLNDHEIDLDDC